MAINYCHLLCCNGTLNSTSSCSLYVDEIGLAMLDEIKMPSEFVFIILTLYSMIFVLGILGNTSICYTIYLVSKKKPIKVTDFFVASMAVTDILMAIFCAPLRQLNSLVFKEWLFGVTICSLVQFLKWCLIVQKSFIMVVISSDRNYFVTRPLKQRMRKRTAQIIVCVTHVMAMGISLPIALKSQIMHFSIGESSMEICVEIWPTYMKKQLFTLTMMTVHCFLPLLIMAVLNIHMSYAILTRKTPGEADERRDKRIISSKRKVLYLPI